MAEDYIFESAHADPPSRFEKFLKIFIFLAVVFLIGNLVWLLGLSAFRPFSKIDISGHDSIPRNEILARAGITGASTFVSTNARAVENSLEGMYAIESVRVFKHFPDKLQIVIEGRKAVGSLLCDINGRTVPVLFDNQGVIFQIGADEAGLLTRPVPVISGLTIENPVPGMRLPVMFIPLFKELEKIQIAAPELLTAISELEIIRKPFDGFDIVLYPVHKRIKVRLSELNEDVLRYTLLMVDVLASQGSGITTLDFRSAIASYIPKEVSSE